MGVLSRDAFDATFQPLDAPSGEPMWRWEETRGLPVNRVWTIMTGDDGESAYACPGYHIVNVEGYVVTVHPWHDETQDAVWYEHDD